MLLPNRFYTVQTMTNAGVKPQRIPISGPEFEFWGKVINSIVKNRTKGVPDVIGVKRGKAI